MTSSAFIDILHSAGPAQDRADKLGLYGFLVGSWETTVIAHEEGGTTHTNHGEIHAGWVLEGRALQDVWMLPRRAERTGSPRQLPITGDWYGTTLRIYDPGLDAWHILWSNPVTQLYTRQIGRARGSDIVQEGRLGNGLLTRWSFTQIMLASFNWQAEISGNDGASWRTQVEVLARRIGAGAPTP
jgi:hypothetical protein